MKINLRGRSEPKLSTDPLTELMRTPPMEPERKPDMTEYVPPSAQETDQDAADNLIAAHRRIKIELGEYKQRTSDALVELRARATTIQQLETSLAEAKNREDQARHEANQAKQDCAKLEQLFQTISAALHSFLYPAEILREKRAEPSINSTGPSGSGFGQTSSRATETIGQIAKLNRLPDQEGSGDQVSG